MVWEFVQNSLADVTTAYANAFKTAAIFDPDRADLPSGPAGDKEFYDEQDKARRARMALYALLAKADFPPARRFSLVFKMNKGLREAFEKDRPGHIRVVNDRGLCAVDSPVAARRVMDWLSARIEESVTGRVPAQYASLDLQS